MLLLGIDSLLLLFITLNLGILTLAIIGKIFRCVAEANILGIMLAGLVTSTIYFNIVSFWWPVNYYCLLPLLVFAIATVFTNKTGAKEIIVTAKQQFALLFTRYNISLTIPLLLVLFYYWIIPPVNADSPDYHYATIAWYEKYRVIPGLANIHGRYAFNAASFIIQAAYSFSGITGQAIYPLNGVLTALFILWLLARIIKNKSTATSIVYLLLLVILSRLLFINISSPTSDTLFVVCLCYSCIKIYDSLAAARTTMQQFILPAILLVYAVTAKLAAFPTLLLLPFLLFCMRGQQKLLLHLVKFMLVSLLICIPWLCRNIILSGYLVYPIYQLDFFNVDWKAHKDVLVLDYAFVKGLSALFSENLAYIQSLPFYQYFFKWFMVQFHAGRPLNFAIFIPALLSPLYWFTGVRKKGAIQPLIFTLWLIIYIDIWVWLYSSPEYRFGITFLAFAITLPWLGMKGVLFTRTYRATRIVLVASMLVIAAIYLADGYHKPTNYAFTPKDYWFYPLKDKQYFTRNDTATFKYTTLANGVKIYVPDRQHACLNAPQLPCIMWPYGAVIESRGPNIEDGFRMLSDSILTIYPNIK